MASSRNSMHAALNRKCVQPVTPAATCMVGTPYSTKAIARHPISNSHASHLQMAMYHIYNGQCYTCSLCVNHKHTDRVINRSEMTTNPCDNGDDRYVPAALYQRPDMFESH